MLIKIVKLKRTITSCFELDRNKTIELVASSKLVVRKHLRTLPQTLT